MKEKEQAEENLREINDAINGVINIVETEIAALETEKCKPLLDEVERLKIEIESSVRDKHKETLSILYKKRKDSEISLNILKVEAAKDLWYPNGTKVWLWEDTSGRRSSASKWEKTNKTGVVVIYDGTQKLGGLKTDSNYMHHGDILVFPHKKDGTIGLKYDKISYYGSIKNWRISWFSETDTYTDNIETRKAKLEKVDEE